MSKKIHMGSRLKVRYDEACGPDGSKLERREILELAEKDLETEGSRVPINAHTGELIDIKVLPSLHAVMECALGVIDSELRQMLRISQKGGGLDRHQSQAFGQMTRSLAQLVGVDQQLKEKSELETMSDEDLIKLAEIATKRLAEGEE